MSNFSMIFKLKNYLFACCTAVVFSGLCVQSGAAQSQFEGKWIGEVKVKGEAQPIRANFTIDRSSFVATLELPLESQTRIAVSGFNVSGSEVRFDLPQPSGLMNFRGQYSRGRIVGVVERSGERGTFRLVRLAQPDGKLYDQLAGAYLLGPGRFVTLGPVQRIEDGLQFIDFQTGRTGYLQPISNFEFIAGPSIGADYPVDIRVTFLMNSRGEVTGLTWQDRGFRSIRAQKFAPYTREDVTFQNGDVTIVGRLTSPATKGTHPVIVLIPGSGPTNREFGPAIYYWIRHNVAVFTYDKRGSGESTGKLDTASIDDLAGDVVAGIEFLKHDPNINPKQIGLWGHSNGGWVAPQVAVRSKDVAFIILRAGSGLPVAENILYEIANDLRERGFSEAEVLKAVTLRRMLTQAIFTNTGWERVRTEVTAAHIEKWFPFARVPERWMTQQDASVIARARHVMDFDPAPVWEKVTCPVLAFSGTLDKFVSISEAVPPLEKALKKDGRKNRRLVTFPRANHWMFEAQTGDSIERPRLKRYVPGFWNVMAAWVKNLLTD